MKKDIKEQEILEIKDRPDEQPVEEQLASPIIVEQQFAALEPVLSDEKFDLLIADTSDNRGPSIPLITWKKPGEETLTLLIGHEAYRALQELEIPLREKDVVIKEFPDEIESKTFVITALLTREDLEVHERCELALQLLDMEKLDKEGKKRMGRGVPGARPLRKYAVVAGWANTGEGSVKKYKRLKEDGPQEIFEKVKNGEIKLKPAYSLVFGDDKKPRKKTKKSESYYILRNPKMMADCYQEVGKIGCLIAIIPPKGSECWFYARKKSIVNAPGFIVCDLNIDAIVAEIEKLESPVLPPEKKTEQTKSEGASEATKDASLEALVEQPI